MAYANPFLSILLVLYLRPKECQTLVQLGEQVLVLEALKDFPNIFMQSETSTNTQKYSENNCASKYIIQTSLPRLLRLTFPALRIATYKFLHCVPTRPPASHATFGNEHHGLCPVSEAGLHHHVVLVPPTVRSLV